jgi:CP family cyanate transporter-like MFS transporter
VIPLYIGSGEAGACERRQRKLSVLNKSSAVDSPEPSGQTLLSLIILWLSGACLRVTIVAVPPLIPLLHRDLHLSESDIGVLSSFPPLLFSIAAVPGALLIARFGVRATLLGGLLLNAIAAAARGAAPNTAFLYATTILMSAGVSIMQPAMPPLVRNWFPRRIGFATAVYTNGLICGEIFVSSLTIPLVLPLVGQSWQASFIAWAVPVVATALLVAVYRRSMKTPQKPLAVAAAPVAWWPNWRDPLIWKLGLLFGSINAMYFVGSAFLPDYMSARGHPELISAALTALNVCQLPASFLMLLFAGRLAGRPSAYLAVGLISTLSLVGIMCSPAQWVVVWCCLLGFSVAVTLILVLALPSILSAPHDVHRASAGMFTISYGSAMIVSVITGLLWQWTHQPIAGFAPIALYGLATLPLCLTVGRAHHKIAKRPIHS